MVVTGVSGGGGVRVAVGTIGVTGVVCSSVDNRDTKQ